LSKKVPFSASDGVSGGLEDVLSGRQLTSLFNKDVLSLNEDVLSWHQLTSLLDEDVLSWRQLTSLFNKDVFSLNKDVLSGRQLTSLLNKDVLSFNEDVLSSREDVLSEVGNSPSRRPKVVKKRQKPADQGLKVIALSTMRL
jgi:predicted butyrate kinase (DUF1464 family)